MQIYVALTAEGAIVSEMHLTMWNLHTTKNSIMYFLWKCILHLGWWFLTCHSDFQNWVKIVFEYPLPAVWILVWNSKIPKCWDLSQWSRVRAQTQHFNIQYSYHISIYGLDSTFYWTSIFNDWNDFCIASLSSFYKPNQRLPLVDYSIFPTFIFIGPR